MTRHKQIILLITLIILAVGPSFSSAWAKDRGKMRVEFLYAIESIGGRGDRLGAPQDIYYDRKAEELYIADASGRGILIFDKNGAFLQELHFDNQYGSATMIATDSAGNFYIGFNRSSKIQVLSFRGEVIQTLDLPGIVDVPGNPIKPMYFAVDPKGRVNILKSQGGIVGITSEGKAFSEFTLGGDDSPHAIFGMAIDRKGRFLFSDMRPYSVVIYDPADNSYQRFGSAGVLYGQLARPQGLTSDDDGHIFVTSMVRSKVLCYDADGNFIEEFGGLGKGYGRFYMPGKLASDGRERLYVLESTLKRVQVFRITFPGGASHQAEAPLTAMGQQG